MPHRKPDPPGGYRLLDFDILDSTNAEAMRRAAAGEAGPLWIRAAEQTAGRGRRSRVWVSLPGNLHATLLLTVTGSASRLTEIGMVAGLASHDTVADLLEGSQGEVALKWPNDVLVDGAKVSGLLLESTGLGSGGSWSLAVGIGINLAHHPDDTTWMAGDLNEFGVSVSPREAMARLAAHMARRLETWDEGRRVDRLRALWAERMSGIGGPLAVTLGDETLMGRFAALDDDGALVLELFDGSQRRIMAGDVFLPQPGEGG